ncbi:Zinc finger protein MAGPIE [Apostasia shenzhenica]|uniref:Protein EARLY HEADING DATE 2 n=1 Tax=Apostasia shenzhenica TaxID=1088818 RepID=A0A2H9ZY41_9ASPA|nr:Zinc finger protein MAGPIE [Apostasia shenzhenica]
MAAASSSSPFFSIKAEESFNQLKPPPSPPPQPPLPSSSTNPQDAAPVKKKRNLPGNPNPDAEVIALSPRTLLATNRFICEVCNKGFQREQNLQLHRRGHNLPWKLKQKSAKEARRRVYLCPEPSCVHHDPSRALGDLTGIKKHFCRKHGEKKWRCEKCSKRYAVQSDWKAHSKTCGTREYRCDCGTLFSRRDSFVTHRAFCDALAQESARLPAGLSSIGSHLYSSNNAALGFIDDQQMITHQPFNSLTHLPDLRSNSDTSPAANPFNLGFFYSCSSDSGNQFYAGNAYSDILTGGQMAGEMRPLFSTAVLHNESANLPQMSATALLQKAAQMGAAASSHGAGGSTSAMLPGFGGSSSGSMKIWRSSQDIMNSINASGESGEEAKFGEVYGGFCNADEQGFQRQGFTRDFLGVGSLLREIGGGMLSHNDDDDDNINNNNNNNNRIDVGSMDHEMKSASAGRSFEGRSLLYEEN